MSFRVQGSLVGCGGVACGGVACPAVRSTADVSVSGVVAGAILLVLETCAMRLTGLRRTLRLYCFHLS